MTLSSDLEGRKEPAMWTAEEESCRHRKGKDEGLEAGMSWALLRIREPMTAAELAEGRMVGVLVHSGCYNTMP